ncbi:hypothetical protein D0C36_03195 [Mucilaginibacter conchicola]|uniref:DUF4412 domain-containing protein n=1 Tax=Mucilaginibacter conchicola TaxID=2303333 RepID=A0A372NYH5_9SPHI|nr:hypothetical protein [Mucilaginibacter conchicola]RFZ94567.1 hypothetical protein D0C36_03195 [Mucilaginibacter conchicola]
MKSKLFTAALGLVLSATAMNASAQKAYKEGVITIGSTIQGQSVEIKTWFRADSSATTFNAGPAAIKVLTDKDAKSMAVLVDVPVASIKKAAIASPAEIEEEQAKLPVFAFTPGTETKVISGFNCKKVVAKDSKSGKTYDIWITNDITLPPIGGAKVYAKAGGVPIQYATFQNGQAAEVTVKSIVEQKVPAGTFGIPADFDKITLDDLKSMGGGN